MWFGEDEVGDWATATKLLGPRTNKLHSVCLCSESFMFDTDGVYIEYMSSA